MSSFVVRRADLINLVKGRLLHVDVVLRPFLKFGGATVGSLESVVVRSLVALLLDASLSNLR